MLVGPPLGGRLFNNLIHRFSGLFAWFKIKIDGFYINKCPVILRNAFGVHNRV